jgi:tRNA threonylcarbamoyladenosine biosynthesis protein TsaE
MESADLALRLSLPDLAATEALGTRLAGGLHPGDAVLLDGRLGAGKSALARALIRAATGCPALEVPSPSYTLVQGYDTPRGPLHHFDLWRLDGPAAMVELGWDEARDGIVVVEWAERLGGLRPDGAIAITLAMAPGDRREAIIHGWAG